MDKVKIVAEIGCNHQGSLSIAKEMILEAKRCGCDYVKFQKRQLGCIPKEFAERPYPGEHSFGNTYLAHRAALELDGAAWRELQEFSEEVGIGFFGTAFDFPSAEFLTNIDVPFLKIGSGQLHDRIFLSSVRDLSCRPELIVSTGMCNEPMVEDLLELLPIKILVHTVSSYPCPETEINLRWISKAICMYQKIMGHENYNKAEEIGLSGHYVAGNGAIEAAAAAMGATYIERHFTLDRTWKGSDHASSLEPLGMMNVVKAVRQVERAMGDGIKIIMQSEWPIIKKLGFDKNGN